MKDCQNCIHFYECDNMGTYEECIENNQSEYEERRV